MNNQLTALSEKLFAEKDGSAFSTLKDKLIRSFAGKERQAVITILVQYSREGQLLHWRTYLLTDIIGLVVPGETEWRSFFEWTITQPALTYWGIDGLLKTAGREAYPTLIALAIDETVKTDQRAKAIKSMAMYSRQPFDRELPADPGYWKPEQLRLTELLAWQEQGYPDGAGYAPPPVHPSLQHPGNDFEKLIAKLDKQLEKKRRKNKDLANPHSWLVMADEKDIADIRHRWALPNLYETFLRYYSPLKVTFTGADFVEGLYLYGAHELVARQAGYAYNGVTGELVADWPGNMLVIGDDGADPYCLDLSAIHDGDAPVYTAEHGQGQWDFELYAESFTGFLQKMISHK
ncbi:SMI1/KNR4 family protein [Chitinophaga qingshengii]|uniref:SMI1/KNR4 family protein n=1 Tax=Chitinophaga qingshengii TaxID=1569794 RepID=A0ABR7TX29_9BACT|nr:SMI1/KNR4 family protein [Chitinophaga qingshengii]MBC9935003.1 SMI1/KNR4 family protein [Chitinophaga qingshengii]